MGWAKKNWCTLISSQLHYLIFHKSCILRILNRQDVVCLQCVCGFSQHKDSFMELWLECIVTNNTLLIATGLCCFLLCWTLIIYCRCTFAYTCTQRSYNHVFAFTHEPTSWTLMDSHKLKITCAHTHTHTLSVILSILQLKGITQVCQILEFQIFMKSTLSAIIQSTPGWHCGIFENHSRPSLLSCVCVCVHVCVSEVRACAYTRESS